MFGYRDNKMAATQGEETTNGTVAQKFGIIQVHVQCMKKSKEQLT
jgi:hypothetical protein